VPVQGRAPAIGEAGHDPSAPAILFGQFRRNVVVSHQHHFQPAAAGPARAARNDGASARSARIVFCFHLLTLSHSALHLKTKPGMAGLCLYLNFLSFIKPHHAAITSGAGDRL